MIPKREYDENEVDPYHGNQEQLQEPEALNLPDNLNLDSEDQNVGEDTDNEEGEGKSSRTPECWGQFICIVWLAQSQFEKTTFHLGFSCE